MKKRKVHYVMAHKPHGTICGRIYASRIAGVTYILCNGVDDKNVVTCSTCLRILKQRRSKP